MSPRRSAPVVGGAVAALLALTTAVLHVGPGVPAPDGVTDFAVANAVTALAFGTVGALVLRSHPAHLVGRLFLIIGLCHGLTGASREVGLLALDAGADSAGAWLIWAGSWLYLATLWGPLLLLLLPDGRPPGPRWRPVVALAWVVPLPIMLMAALYPGPVLLAPLPGRGRPPDNPLGGVELAPLADVSGVLFLACGAAALVSLAVRWRAAGEQRQQLKWVALAGGLSVAAVPVDLAAPAVGVVLAPVAVATFATAVGIAIVRHRLFDVDVVISRAVAYAALTVTLVGVYVSVVTLIGGLLRGGDDVLSGLVAAGLVAALFAPLRETLQRGVDRLLYGMRAEPYAVAQRVLDAVDRSPSSDDILPQLSATVAGALRLPWARVLLEGEAPGEVPADALHLPLRHRGEPVGALLLGARPGGKRLTGPEERLLADLTRQAAAAAHAVQLTRDLARSRDRLVEVREQERGRLRRDLHDGVGPLLAAITVQVDAARHLLAADPDRAVALLGEVKTEVQHAVVDVRRLLDDLRPAVLDDAGLPAAVARLVGRLRDAGLEVELDAPERIELPAAVETAAYRVVAEALTNVVRHAGAASVRVRLHLDGEDLAVEVHDDGLGLPQQPGRGVGLDSMRARAEELQGTLSVTSEPGAGTLVRARLPLGVAA